MIDSSRYQVKGAQERGAVGCLIYSDPRDDGSVRYQNGYAAYVQGVLLSMLLTEALE